MGKLKNSILKVSALIILFGLAFNVPTAYAGLGSSGLSQKSVEKAEAAQKQRETAMETLIAAEASGESLEKVKELATVVEKLCNKEAALWKKARFPKFAAKATAEKIRATKIVALRKADISNNPADHYATAKICKKALNAYKLAADKEGEEREAKNVILGQAQGKECVAKKSNRPDDWKAVAKIYIRSAKGEFPEETVKFFNGRAARAQAWATYHRGRISNCPEDVETAAKQMELAAKLLKEANCNNDNLLCTEDAAVWRVISAEKAVSKSPTYGNLSRLSELALKLITAHEAAGHTSDADLREYRFMAKEVKMQAEQVAAGKSYIYAKAYAECVVKGKSENYASYYATKVEDGECSSYASAFAQQKVGGKSDTYASYYARRIENGDCMNAADIYANQRINGKSHAYAQTYAFHTNKGRSHTLASNFADAFEKQINLGKPQNYAYAYAAQIVEGNSPEFAHNYASQIQAGKSDDYATGYAYAYRFCRKNERSISTFAANYQQKRRDGKSEVYAKMYAYYVATCSYQYEGLEAAEFARVYERALQIAGGRETVDVVSDAVVLASKAANVVRCQENANRHRLGIPMGPHHSSQ